MLQEILDTLGFASLIIAIGTIPYIASAALFVLGFPFIAWKEWRRSRR